MQRAVQSWLSTETLSLKGNIPEAYCTSLPVWFRGVKFGASDINYRNRICASHHPVFVIPPIQGK